jgi:hypothetical protein
MLVRETRTKAVGKFRIVMPAAANDVFLINSLRSMIVGLIELKIVEKRSRLMPLSPASWRGISNFKTEAFLRLAEMRHGSETLQFECTLLK